jgi:hypothetical protein
LNTGSARFPRGNRSAQRIPVPRSALPLASTLLLCWLALAPATGRADPPTPAVAPQPAMATPRAVHQATLLASGELLVTGGCVSAGCDHATGQSERYDPAGRRFRPAAAMQAARSGHAAVALADGRVLVAGGWVDGRTVASAELYEPGNDRWSAAPDLAEPRGMPTATALADGRVLLAGGSRDLSPLASAEIFDPASGSFGPAASMQVARQGHAAVRLRDGRVLVTGGQSRRRGPVLASAELYDAVSGRFEATGGLLQARSKHAAVLLADGRVAIVGGADDRDSRGRLSSIEYYDPDRGVFSAGPELLQPRYKLPAAVVALPSGRVLVAGGAAFAELLDPRRDTLRRLEPGFGAGFEFATANLLDDGGVLVLGGYDGDIVPTAAAWRIADLAH